MKHIHYIFFAALALLSSCEKPIDFDPGEVSPYVVMISKPVNDSLMSVYVGYSRFFLDNRQFVAISDATVTLTDGTGTYAGVYDPKCFFLSDYYGYYGGDEYWYGDSVFYGGYAFTLRPQPGDTLRLTATVPGYDKTVTASTSIPQLPEIEVVDCIVDTTDYYNYYYRLRFKVKSHSDAEYYSVAIKNAVTRYISSSDTYYWDTVNLSPVYFSVNDPLVNSSDIEDVIDGYDGSFYGNEMYFSSDMFQGGEHEFTAVFSLYPYDYSDPSNELDYRQVPILLEVKSLTRELYRYEKTSVNAEYNSFDGLFSEPTQVICNVKGGIGVFGGASQKTFKTKANRCEVFSHNDGYYFKKGRK